MALPPEEEQSVDAQVFKDAIVLTNTETNFILAQYIQSKQENLGGAQFQIAPVVKKSKEYVEKFSQGSNEENTREIRRILHQRGFKEFEVGIIANLMPADADEAMTLLPSLKDPSRFPLDPSRTAEDEINQALEEISLYRTFQ